MAGSRSCVHRHRGMSRTLSIGRYEHHQLASMIAKSDMSDAQCSALTGYSVATISNLRYQKAFKELVSFYKKLDEPPPSPDLVERIRDLGLSTLEELKERLLKDPSAWSNYELMAMTRLLLVEAQGTKETKAEPERLRVAIQFVPPPKEEALALEDPRVIEHEP